MTERNVGGTTATFDGGQLEWCYCIRVDLPSPVGTKRFAGGGYALGDVVDDIDGTGVQTWSFVPLDTGGLDQGDQASDVTHIAFGNLDANGEGQWSNWNRTLKLLNVTVDVWVVYFDPITHARVNVYKTYPGRIDYRSIGDWAELRLKPQYPPWTREAPSITVAQIGAASLMPDPGVPQYLGDQLRSNLLRMPPTIGGDTGSGSRG